MLRLLPERLTAAMQERRLDPRTLVGVSWYEANAYCAWLTEELRGRPAAEGGIGSHEKVALPSQAEWMQAARDGQPAPPSKDHVKFDGKSTACAETP